MATVPNATKIILADDNEVYKEGFKLIINQHCKNEIQILYDLSDGIDLLEKVKMHKPNLVITSNKLLRVNGMNACKMIKQKYRKVKVIFLVHHPDENSLMEILECGAEGFILINSQTEILLHA